MVARIDAVLVAHALPVRLRERSAEPRFRFTMLCTVSIFHPDCNSNDNSYQRLWHAYSRFTGAVGAGPLVPPTPADRFRSKPMSTPTDGIVPPPRPPVPHVLPPPRLPLKQLWTALPRQARTRTLGGLCPLLIRQLQQGRRAGQEVPHEHH